MEAKKKVAKKVPVKKPEPVKSEPVKAVEKDPCDGCKYKSLKNACIGCIIKRGK